MPTAITTRARRGIMPISPDDPHASQPVRHRGPVVAQARLAIIAIHGRGASADDILSLTSELRTTDVTYLAPEAAGHTWYPYSFLSPIEQNEPWLSSALNLLSRLVTTLGEQGVAADRIGFLGFSQGACLALEFAARQARRYAAVVGLSGGLIGPPGTPRTYPGAFDGTPVFLGCSDVDPHIPVDRVRETAATLTTMQATVDARIYRGMGHTVNTDEISAVQAMLARR
jgi:predicted esterase